MLKTLVMQKRRWVENFENHDIASCVLLKVKQLCQPILSEGPGSVFEDALYWLAVQVLSYDFKLDLGKI